jgi:hypothetical protein
MQILQEFTYDTKYNQTRHEIEIYLDNGAGASDDRRYPINPNAIVNLTIEDTLADWVVRGHLSFYYNPESNLGAPGQYSDKLGQVNESTGISSPVQKGFYIFRNDGNDYLRIRIKPNIQDVSNFAAANYNNNAVVSDEKHWTISYLFSIYDIEDIDLPPGARNQASSTMKCLKLYFWDSWYQKLITNYPQYSTALSLAANPEADRLSGEYSNQGLINTGLALRELIDLGLSVDTTQENYTGDVSGYTDPSLQIVYNPTAPLGEEWEEGSGKIFYTNPAQINAFDAAEYLLKRHVSNVSINSNNSESEEGVHDFSILIKERGPEPTDVGQLTLKPMSSFFKKAGKSQSAPGEYQIEHFFLQAYGNNPGVDRATKSYRAPISNNSNDTVDFKSLKYNQITNYRFVDISALTNATKFHTTPVHSFDFLNRTFNIDNANNTVTDAREFIAKKYINEIYKGGGNNEDLFTITLDTDKQKKNVCPALSLYGDSSILRQADGIKKLLYVGVFQNMCINFRALGLTSREPGRFIAIDKIDGVESGAFEDKFYGQWFVINVKRVFETEFFYDDITAIKVHRYNPLPLSFTNTLNNQ